MEKVRKADPEIAPPVKIEGMEFPPSQQFVLEHVGIEMEILCTKCLNVFKFDPYGMYLKEKDGKRALVGFVAPITGKPFVCENCREGGAL